MQADDTKESDAKETSSLEASDLEKEGGASKAETSGHTPDVEMEENVANAEKNVLEDSKGNKSDTDKEKLAPKRKLLSDIDGNVGASNASPEKKSRIEKKNLGVDDSSDEEVDFGLDTQPPPGALMAGGEAKKLDAGLVIDDDEDDDE